MTIRTWHWYLLTTATTLTLTACQGPALTPQAYRFVDLRGPIEEATGRASLRDLPDDQFEVSIDLPSGASGEWSTTVRDGTCTAPGSIRFQAGPVEGGLMVRSFPGRLADVEGLIVVISPIGQTDLSACGEIGP